MTLRIAASTGAVFAAFFVVQLALASSQFSPPKPRPKECRGNANGKASEQQVADNFFKQYGPWQRPRLNSSDTVVVNITFVLSAVNDVLERERIMKISGYISVRWMDEFRIWNESFPYNCVDYVVLPATDIWLPDIAQMNSEGRYTLMGMEGEKVRVYSNGYVVYSPGGTFFVYCDYDLTMFPFDYQTCAIKLESWRYTHQYMSFQFGKNVTIKYFTVNEQWELVGTSQQKVAASYMEPWNSFDHVEFYIMVKRKVMYYMMNVIIPSILIAVAHLATFTLPVGDIEKVNISFTCLLAYSVFQVMVVGDMPRSSDHIPLLSYYIDLQMAYIAFSMLGEGMSFVALNKIDENGLNGQAPTYVPQFLLKVSILLGGALFLREQPPTADDSKYPAKPQRERPRKREDGEQQQNGFINSHMIDFPLGRLGLMPPIPEEPKDTVDETGETATPPPVPPQLPNRSTRNKKMRRRQTGRATNERSTVGLFDPLTFDLRQMQWQYLANVIERMVAVLYVLCISMTPFVMFGIYPMTVTITKL